MPSPCVTLKKFKVTGVINFSLWALQDPRKNPGGKVGVLIGKSLYCLVQFSLLPNNYPASVDFAEVGPMVTVGCLMYCVEREKDSEKQIPPDCVRWPESEHAQTFEGRWRHSR